MKRLSHDEKILKDLGERHLTDDDSFSRQTWKEFESNSGRLEESGKILGKDLWVMGLPKRNTIVRS